MAFATLDSAMNLRSFRTTRLYDIAGRLLLVLVLASCTPLASPYSEQSYRNATELKAHSLALVAVSGEAFSQHQDEVRALLTDIDAAYEYARGLPQNQVVTEQWRLIRDPNSQFVGKFAAEWQRKGQFGALFRQEYAGEIAFAFDTIICVEITKKAAADCGPVQEGQ